MKVEHILTSKGAEVFAVSGEETIGQAVNVLGEKNIGAVIVKNEKGDVSGILSERDVVRRLQKEGPALMDQPVSACMTPDPITCGKEASLEELMSLMTEKRIRHVPVVEGGRLVGVVSIGDVVKRKIETAEKEAEALRDYIAS